MFPLPPNPRLLLIESSRHTRTFLTLALQEAGYHVTAVDTLDCALVQIQSVTFDLIISPWQCSRHGAMGARFKAFLSLAKPTPVAILTSRLHFMRHEIEPIAFVCKKPIDLDELFGHIATVLFSALNWEEDEDTALLLRYFERLRQPDCRNAADLCSENVIYAPPPRAPSQDVCIGREAYRQFLALSIPYYPERTIDHIRIYPFPEGEGRIVRYHISWLLSNGQRAEFSSSVSYTIRGGEIALIGVSRYPETLPTSTVRVTKNPSVKRGKAK